MTRLFSRLFLVLAVALAWASAAEPAAATGEVPPRCNGTAILCRVVVSEVCSPRSCLVFEDYYYYPPA
jgi:hypothetical protein